MVKSEVKNSEKYTTFSRCEVLLTSTSDGVNVTSMKCQSEWKESSYTVKPHKAESSYNGKPHKPESSFTGKPYKPGSLVFSSDCRPLIFNTNSSMRSISVDTGDSKLSSDIKTSRGSVFDQEGIPKHSYDRDKNSKNSKSNPEGLKSMISGIKKVLV